MPTGARPTPVDPLPRATYTATVTITREGKPNVPKLLFSWSAGKDSALALYQLLQDPAHQVLGLLTTVAEEHGRSSAHGIRPSLLQRHADSIGLPLQPVPIPSCAANETYEQRLAAALGPWQEAGVTAIGFGDLFLADVRAYRERHLASLGLRALFPLWGRDTRQVAESVIRLGFHAVVTFVDTQALDPRFAGRTLDARFLAEVPPASTPAARTASTTPLSPPAPSSASRCPSPSGTPSCATAASPASTSCRAERGYGCRHSAPGTALPARLATPR